MGEKSEFRGKRKCHSCGTCPRESGKQKSRKKELKMTDEAKLGDWEIMKLRKEIYPALYAYELCEGEYYNA